VDAEGTDVKFFPQGGMNPGEANYPPPPSAFCARSCVSFL